jgi:hypothetical protein
MMITPEVDKRSTARRAQDERIAAEPHLPPPELPTDATPSQMELHLRRQHRHPMAVTGVVENGLVRPLDPAVKLKEQSRVIIVAAEET